MSDIEKQEPSNYILSDNLMYAISVAISAQEKREQENGYTSDSALLSGWRNNLSALSDGRKLIIKYEE